MNYLKNISISIGLVFFLTFIMTLLNYLNIIGSNLITVIKIFILIFSLFISGLYIEKKTNKQGWLEGLKLSLLFLILLILFEYLFLDNHFEFKNILYYLIISISCIFGSMIGISKRLEKN